MTKKSHLKFLNDQQKPEVKEFKYNYGFDSNREEELDNIPIGCFVSYNSILVNSLL